MKIICRVGDESLVVPCFDGGNTVRWLVEEAVKRSTATLTVPADKLEMRKTGLGPVFHHQGPIYNLRMGQIS
jgi:N-terminal of Par3 and HAL proteins